jgi:hypothetical protein
MKHEAVTNTFTSSTGAIVLLTLFHLLTGDRGLTLGSSLELPSHLHTLLAFSTGVALASYLLWKQRKEVGFWSLLANCLLPLGLHWSTTFMIQRVYNATYYAIYSLPVFLVLITKAISGKDSSFIRCRATLLLIIILVNGFTLMHFLRNTMVPYEPWKRACAVLRTFEPVMVFIYPSHMAVMLTLYGDDLPVQGIDFPCHAQDTEKEIAFLLEKLKPGYTFLILSHDWGKGDCLVTYFRQVLGGDLWKLDFPNIRLFLFKKP